MKKYLAIILPLLLNAPAHADAPIRSLKTQRFISMENGQFPATCNRRNSGPWEKFVTEGAGDGYYYIKSTQNNKYLRRSGNKNYVTCTHSKNTSDNRMKWKPVGHINKQRKKLSGNGLKNKSNGKELKQRGKQWRRYVAVNTSSNNVDSNNRFGSDLFN